MNIGVEGFWSLSVIIGAAAIDNLHNVKKNPRRHTVVRNNDNVRYKSRNDTAVNVFSMFKTFQPSQCLTPPDKNSPVEHRGPVLGDLYSAVGVTASHQFGLCHR